MEPSDPIAAAHAIQAEVNRGRSVAAVGRDLGLSRTTASHRLRLLRLAPSVQARVSKGKLELGKARALVGLPEHAQLDLVQPVKSRLLARMVVARSQRSATRLWKVLS